MESAPAQAAEPGGRESRLDFTLDYWCLWQSKEGSAPGCWPGGDVLPYNQGSADVGFLPAMQRRRLSPLARAACAVAWRCRQVGGEMPTVFFSAHGESQYYFEMLDGMAASEHVSPSRFSLCVHNAIAGLSTIHSESFQPYVCLAGGTDGIFAAFLEAGGMLMEVPKILLVWYEQALPEIYRPYLETPETTWALAMILSRPGEAGHQLRLAREPAFGEVCSESAKTGLLQSILEGRLSSQCRLDRAVWRWSLDDA